MGPVAMSSIIGSVAMSTMFSPVAMSPNLMSSYHLLSHVAMSSILLNVSSVGVRYAGVHRSRGDTAARLREAGRLVVHGGHPLRVPRGVRSFLWRHP